MSSSKNYKRDYKRERKLQLESPKSDLEANASRKAARRVMEAKGAVKKNDGKDVDHKNRNPKDNSPKNLSVKSKSANRSFSRKSQYAKGGMVKANCGASMKPTQRKK